jgi:hypothetical protein
MWSERGLIELLLVKLGGEGVEERHDLSLVPAVE